MAEVGGAAPVALVHTARRRSPRHLDDLAPVAYTEASAELGLESGSPEQDALIGYAEDAGWITPDPIARNIVNQNHYVATDSGPAVALKVP